MLTEKSFAFCQSCGVELNSREEVISFNNLSVCKRLSLRENTCFLAKFHDISLSLIELGNNCWVVVASGHFKPKYFSTEAILYTHGRGSRMGVSVYHTHPCANSSSDY